MPDAARQRGRRIGLLGGSFNPPHEGHVHISRIAIQTLKLDALWWLVSPCNPLKSPEELLPFEERMALCREMTRHDPHILISDLEERQGLNRSYDTLLLLKKRLPLADLVFVTGMDNALIFHKWYRWRDILDLAATAHIARPPAWSIAENCTLRLQSTQNHRVLHRAENVPLKPRHTYWILQRRMLPVSSTEIRNSY